MMEWEPFGMERQFIAVGPLLSLFLSLFLILFLLFCGLMARYKNYYFYFYLFLIIICILFCCRFGLEENLTREWKRWKLVLIVYLSFYFLLFLFFHFLYFILLINLFLIYWWGKNGTNFMEWFSIDGIWFSESQTEKPSFWISIQLFERKFYTK